MFSTTKVADIQILPGQSATTSQQQSHPLASPPSASSHSTETPAPVVSSTSDAPPEGQSTSSPPQPAADEKQEPEQKVASPEVQPKQEQTTTPTTVAPAAAAPPSSTQPAASHSVASEAITPKSTVFLISADFALQNVAMQMGLSLLALGGRMITSVRRFVLYCPVCEAIERNTERKFCGICGCYQLRKVGCSVVDETYTSAMEKQNKKAKSHKKQEEAEHHEEEKKEEKEEKNEKEEKKAEPTDNKKEAHKQEKTQTKEEKKDEKDDDTPGVRMVVFLRRRRFQPCFKGTRYHVTLPRGGKDQGLVLSEDVYLERLRKNRPRLGHGKTKEDVVGATAAFDSGYNPLSAPPVKQLFVLFFSPLSLSSVSFSLLALLPSEQDAETRMLQNTEDLGRRGMASVNHISSNHPPHTYTHTLFSFHV